MALLEGADCHKKTSTNLTTGGGTEYFSICSSPEGLVNETSHESHDW